MLPTHIKSFYSRFSCPMVIGTVIIAALAAFAVPLEGLPLADGFPLSHPFELLGLSLLVCLVSALPTARFPRRALAAAFVLAVVVLVAKVSISRQQVPHGLMGGYWVTLAGEPGDEPAHHRRVVPTLDFANTGGRWAAKPFPFDFVNDQDLFPWVGLDSTVHPIFHATWRGFIRPLDGRGPIDLSLQTPDGCGLWLDEKPLIPPGRGNAHCGAPKRVMLAPGLHPITVTYRQEVPSQQALSRTSGLVLRWRRPGEVWQPVPAPALLPHEVAPAALDRSDRVRPLVWAVWLLGFAPLLALAAGAAHGLMAGEWLASRARWALVAALASVVYFGWTVREFRDPSDQYVWLNSDSTHYETEARAMLRERRLGVPSHGHEAKVGYVYYLAAVHATFGGNLFHVVFGQRLLVLTAALGVGGLARRIHGPRAAAYAAGLTLAATHLLGWSRAVFPAIWAAALAAVGIWMLTRVMEGEDAIWSFGAGGLLAMAVYSRPNLVGFVPFALVWLAWVLKDSKNRRLLVLSCLAGVCVVAAAFALRRWVIYGQWTNPQGLFLINLFDGNRPPPWIDLTALKAWGRANAPGLSPDARTFLAFAVLHPAGLLALWGKKALYQVGINFLYPPYTSYVSQRFVYEIFYFNALALAGGVVVWRRGWPREAWLPVAFVGLNMAALTITTPILQGFRLEMPSLVFLMAFAGAAVAALEEAWPWRRARLAHGLAAAVLMVTLPFRYGLQYAVIGLAWLIGQVGEHRRPAVADELAPDAANPPIPARGTK